MARVLHPRLWAAGMAVATAACGSRATVDDPGNVSSSAIASSGSGGAASTASSSAPASGTGGAGGVGAVMVLDPSTLEFFELPTGAPRYAVGGQDLASDTCVVVYWLIADPFVRQCVNSDTDWPEGVAIIPMATAPCTEWRFPGTVPDDATGCYQFFMGNPLSGAVDVTVSVTDPLFTGTIVIDNVR